MIRFATDGIAPEDRFEHWRELRAKQVLGVTLELPVERRRSFQGRFRARLFGNVTVSSMRASAYTVKRTDSDIARVTGHSLCIGHQLEGPGHIATPNGLEKVNKGDLTIGFSDIPFVATPSGDKAFHYRMTKIPVTAELALGAHVEHLYTARAESSSPAFGPMKALFRAIHADTVVDGSEEMAGLNLGRLALATRGVLPFRLPEVRKAMRQGTYYAALEIMDANKSDAGITPDAVAATLGISRRQLFTLFEEAETSFAKTLSRMRIGAARQWLLDQPHVPVIDIAFGCGFESLATFYRVFGNSFGASPGELRHRINIGTP